MDLGAWDVKSHIIPASHIRGYKRGVRDETKHRLQLSVNQYTPTHTSEPPTYAATIVFVHGIGSTKESYEPFFANLLKAGLPIRSIWAADLAWHGQSYLINEDVIGDEPHWDDVARDTIHLINTFQEEMPPPIIAIGQSFGGYPVMQSALMHPRLFTALVALEPSIASRASSKSEESNYHGATALAMVKRRDTWESREAARTALLKNPYFAAFDPHVFEKVMKHDLRDAPTAESPHAVTLTTPKAMEAGSLLRLEPPPSATGSERDPDFVPGTATVLPGFYRTEADLIQTKLQSLRPPVLYVFGTKSKMPAVYLQFLIATTGTGSGGSGGAATEMVEGVWVEGAGHPMPLEKPKETAEAMVPWLKKQIERWYEEYLHEDDHKQFWTKKINPKWLEMLSKL